MGLLTLAHGVVSRQQVAVHGGHPHEDGDGVLLPLQRSLHPLKVGGLQESRGERWW